MLTEELSRLLAAAAESQPYVPDVGPALHRARQLRRRNHLAAAAAGVAVVAAVVVVPVTLLGSSTHQKAIGLGAGSCPPTSAGTPARHTADDSGFGWPLRGDGPAPLPAGTTQFTSQPIVGRTTLWTGHARPDGSVPELLVEKTTTDEFIVAAVIVSSNGTDTLAVHRVLRGTAQISAVLPFGTNGTVLVVTRPGLGDVLYQTPASSWQPADKISGTESGPGWVLFPRQVSAHFDQSPDSIKVLAENCAVAYAGPIGQPDKP
ncbi:MAG: hypothetical protein QOH57_3764 [Mycobacterium sp.]|jgi:hypothetical protein|nr:hypothetical protein [Mycobacterium sp.]